MILLRKILKKILPMNNQTMGLYIMINKLALTLKIKKNIKKYSLNIETTTVCDAKCKFCTHNDIIRNKIKIPKHMKVDQAKLIIDKLVELTKDIPQDQIYINPTGLGEPTLNPDLFFILEYIKLKFPASKIYMNTNCIGLNKELGSSPFLSVKSLAGLMRHHRHAHD